jgi:hypothetical protein
MAFFIATAVNTSNLTQLVSCQSLSPQSVIHLY